MTHAELFGVRTDKNEAERIAEVKIRVFLLQVELLELTRRSIKDELTVSHKIMYNVSKS